MRSMDDGKRRYHFEAAQENPSSNHAAASNFESQNGNVGNKPLRHRKVLGSRAKPTPSKWDDAQKWLVGFSGRGDHKHAAGKPRNSNADDRRLLTSLSQRGRDSCSSADGAVEYDVVHQVVAAQEEGELKKIDCSEPYWRRATSPAADPPVVVRSICLRDTGTEMTPIASKEPSRTGTPLRATTPVLKSPISSRSSSPGRCREGAQRSEGHQAGARNLELRAAVVAYGVGVEIDGSQVGKMNGFPEGHQSANSLESRAMAWDEAERAKYTARYKREEVRIQAWENHEKRKAEMEMKKMEVKAERIKSRAQEKYANKLAAARRMAEEKRANAEAKLSEHGARTAERADYIRRTGHLPSAFFSFKLPSLCN